MEMDTIQMTMVETNQRYEYKFEELCALGVASSNYRIRARQRPIEDSQMGEWNIKFTKLKKNSSLYIVTTC